MAVRILPDPITAESLLGLIEAGISEGQTIEFKRTIDLSDSSRKLKLCASVASFANASGGDIIFGAEASEGAVTFVGLQPFDPDKLELQLRQILDSNIEPKVPGLNFVTNEPEAGRTVLVLRIARSWNRPHAVLAENPYFPIRDGNRRRPLKVAELRESFGLSVAISDRMRRFRSERLGLLMAGETSVPLSGSRLIVVHLMPASAFDTARQIDLGEARKPLVPIGATGSGARMNFDGVIHTSPSLGVAPGEKIRSYVQVFRNGCIEAVNATFAHVGPNEERLLYPSYEGEVARSVASYLQAMRRFEIEPPIFFGLGILGSPDFRLSGLDCFLRPEPTDMLGADPLLIPESAIESYEEPIENKLKESFDWVWHAAGKYCSPNYDEDGHWRPATRE